MASISNLLRRQAQTYRVLCKIREIPSSSFSNNEIHGSKNQKSWRKTWDEKGDWRSSLGLFASKDQSESVIMRLIQAPIDLRPVAIKIWLKKKRREVELFEQRYIKDRHRILGTDLASAHFILFRGGRVRFLNDDKWYVGNDHKLPEIYTPGFFVEEIDASNMKLYYEGLQNLHNLKYLKRLHLNSSEHIDDWCLDYLSGEFRQTLEYLDISNCQKITERGLASLYRLKHLKFLNVTKIPTSKAFELSCLLLEDLHNGLKIEGTVYK